MASFEDYNLVLHGSSKPELENVYTEEKDSASEGTLAELIDLTEMQRPGGQRPSITQTPNFKRPRNTSGHYGRYNEYGLRVIRKLDTEGDSISTELAIASEPIQNALRAILTNYAFLNLAADPIIIPEPYEPLFHHRVELQEYTVSAQISSHERKHMEIFMDKFMKVYLQETRRIFTEEVNKGWVTFDYLWTLFRGEDDVLFTGQHFEEIYRVVGYEYVAGEGEKRFRIHAWRWGYNNKKFGPCSETIDIVKFTSAKRIEQLPCYPLRVLEDEKQEQLKARFIARGRRWRQLIAPSHKQYHGISHLIAKAAKRRLIET